MHFSKKEQLRVANSYSLGKVISCELIAGGLVNYNYKLITNSGKYIVRFLAGHSAKNSKADEFAILNHLAKNRFLYEIPTPLKNKSGAHITSIRGMRLWVYRRLEGEHLKNTPVTRRELAICNAKLNLCLKKLQGKVNKNWPFTVNKIYSQYRYLLNNPKIKNKVDKLFFSELEFMYALAIKLGDFEPVPKQWIHSDIYFSNVLGNKKKITGILDFDNVVYLRRTFDIASTLCSVCTKNGKFNASDATKFMRYYEGISPLSKKERDSLVREMLRVQVVGCLWLYMKMKKFPERKFLLIKETVTLAHELAEIEWSGGI